VVHRSGGLLDDVAAPVVMLAGSSYSLNSGFIDYLQLDMKQEIAQQSRLGSGFAGSVLELLQHHPERLNDIKLLIWEWPLRSLYQPLTDEENTYLAQQ
jgi:alginate O-acetyltransferase complex protein AlgJ